MFRYESRAFTQTADVLQNACGELDQYEDVIRSISRAWSRNPDMPAPRERLRKELERLEEKETSLNMLKRKLEAAARLYETAENRALDLAEATAEAAPYSGRPYGISSSYPEEVNIPYVGQSQRQILDPLIDDGTLSRLATLLFEKLFRPGYISLPIIRIILPGRLFPWIRPIYPWLRKVGPGRNRGVYTWLGPASVSPVVPLIWRTRIHQRSFISKRRPNLTPTSVLRETVSVWKEEGPYRIMQPLGIDSAERRARRTRMTRLFRL